MMAVSRGIAAAILFAGVTLAVLVGSASNLQAQGIERNILTGGPNGTYIQIGRDISRIAAECNLELNVRESAGSLENFLGVRKRRHTQFGIVQSDVLEYLSTYSANDPSIARAIAGVRIAFPLYNEEVHVLARNDIAGLSDLSGRKVAIGVEDSGTYLTASLVLDLAGVQPSERLTINATDSLAALLSGEIDAFFYVAGAPAGLFQSTEIDADRFHLLPIDDPTLQAVYLQSEIPADTYPFQTDAVEVVAVKAVLMTYEYDPNKNSYHRLSCDAVAEISNLILTHLEELKQTGHPKWQSVDLNDIPPGWNIGNCVNRGLAEDFSMACNAPADMSQQPESDANKAYRSRICAVMGC